MDAAYVTMVAAKRSGAESSSPDLEACAGEPVIPAFPGPTARLWLSTTSWKTCTYAEPGSTSVSHDAEAAAVARRFTGIPLDIVRRYVDESRSLAGQLAQGQICALMCKDDGDNMVARVVEYRQRLAGVGSTYRLWNEHPKSRSH